MRSHITIYAKGILRTERNLTRVRVIRKSDTICYTVILNFLSRQAEQLAGAASIKNTVIYFFCNTIKSTREHIRARRMCSEVRARVYMNGVYTERGSGVECNGAPRHV